MTKVFIFSFLYKFNQFSFPSGAQVNDLIFLKTVSNKEEEAAFINSSEELHFSHLI